MNVQNKQHKTKNSLCKECFALKQYAYNKINKCLFLQTKSFCSCCTLHCYNKEMLDKIRNVMRFSGPELIFSHPITVINHLIKSIKTWLGGN